jgi:hypothetical protein
MVNTAKNINFLYVLGSLYKTEVKTNTEVQTNMLLLSSKQSNKNMKVKVNANYLKLNHPEIPNEILPLECDTIPLNPPAIARYLSTLFEAGYRIFGYWSHKSIQAYGDGVVVHFQYSSCSTNYKQINFTWMVETPDNTKKINVNQFWAESEDATGISLYLFDEPVLPLDWSNFIDCLRLLNVNVI